MLNDRTQGQDQVPDMLVYILSLFATSPLSWADQLDKVSGEWIYTPVWVPQIAMSIGTVLLAICLWDHFIRLVVTGASEITSETVE